MLDIVNLADKSTVGGALSGFAQGIVNIPADLYYAGYEYLDTEHRSRNNNDTIRFMNLVKNGLLNRESIQKILIIVIGAYFNKLKDEQKEKLVAKKIGKLVGKFVFTSQAVSPIVSLFATRFISKFALSSSSTLLLGLGACRARSIYSAYELQERNPAIYWEMRKAGNLDLLYFVVEKQMEPFLTAIEMQQSSPEEADRLFNEFLGGL